MSRRTYLTHARIVLLNEVVEDGSLLLEGAEIAAVCPERGPGDAGEIDLAGTWLLPGMVDLHSDDIEIQFQPRPNISLPASFAVLEMDRKAAAAGITTMYPSLSFCGTEIGVRADDHAAELVREIHALRDCLLIDHRPHCRYEVTNPHALPIIESLIDQGACQLVSLMDHTPGQGQFPTIESYRRFFKKRYGHDDDHLDSELAAKLGEGAQRAIERMQRLAQHAQASGIPLASHDDDGAERVELMCTLGAAIAEFPLSVAGAAAARQAGLHTVFGSPNVFRGGSQSHGMKAIDAIAAGHADCLASDYLPASMLPATFRVAADLGWPLDEAAKVTTWNPAQAGGFSDRGQIAPGFRADVIAVRSVAQRPQVVRTWAGGRLVFSADYPL
jgi:alpha-D-ribose 1-methylphosphonate 5-triphosphate diphosphatase